MPRVVNNITLENVCAEGKRRRGGGRGEERRERGGGGRGEGVLCVNYAIKFF